MKCSDADGNNENSNEMHHNATFMIHTAAPFCMQTE